MGQSLSHPLCPGLFTHEGRFSDENSLHSFAPHFFDTMGTTLVVVGYWSRVVPVTTSFESSLSSPGDSCHEDTVRMPSPLLTSRRGPRTKEKVLIKISKQQVRYSLG